MLWELGGSRPEASHKAFKILMDAARFAQPGGAVEQQLTSIQPTLALCYCAELPSLKASLSPAASAKAFSSDVKGQAMPGGGQIATSQLAKLPEQSQVRPCLSPHDKQDSPSKDSAKKHLEAKILCTVRCCCLPKGISANTLRNHNFAELLEIY